MPAVDDPLRQGDILKNLVFYATHEDGDGAMQIEADYCLVLSRHCNALRKSPVTVAIINEVTPEELSRLSDLGLDETRRLLAALRDGDGKPDRFYLGPLPGREPKRALARLDLIFSVQVPEVEAVRRRWIHEHRCASLSDEHRRHLHVSVLLAFGREGFDDFAWWPDADLKLMLLAGEDAVAKAEQKQRDIARSYQAAPAATEDRKLDAKLQGITRQVEKARGEVKAARDALAPYWEEWRRRHGPVNPFA